MRVSFPSALMLALLFSASALAAPDTVFVQPPDQYFGLSSDTAWVDSFGQQQSSLVADNFSLSQPETICGARVFAFFGGTDEAPGTITPPATETIRYRFYSDAGGVPGDVLWENAYVDPPRVWTGRQIAIFPPRREYEYTKGFSNCFSAAANTTYWFEVAQLGDINSRFRWESSYSDVMHAVQFPIGSQWATTGPDGMAFELLRTPEPGALPFFVLIWPLFVRLSERRSLHHA